MGVLPGYRKGAAMTNVFAAEWVQLQTIAAKQPDPTMFPMVNDALKQSMVQQTMTFFQDLLTNGGAIRCNSGSGESRAQSP